MSNRRKMKEAGLPCMLNTEIGCVLAVLRKGATELSVGPAEESPYQDMSLQQSLRSLRTMIFNPQQNWRHMDPSIYLSPFLDVILSDEVPAVGTMVALAAILKIVKIEIFNDKTPGAKDAMNAIVVATTGCRVEKTATHVQEAILMRILQILTAAMNCGAAILLSDDAVCTIVNTCFNVLRQPNISDLLKRTAHYTMHEIIRNVYTRLTEIDLDNGCSHLEDEEEDDFDYVDEEHDSGYGIRCAVDIFQFLCSLMNVSETVESVVDGSYMTTSVQRTNEEVQMVALVMMNTAIELSGDMLGKHPRLLRMIQDDLLHHLLHYGTRTSPLVLSMICSTVFNIYNFLRGHIRLQMEAYFVFVLFRVASPAYPAQMQEVALEAIVNFLRHETFLIDMYVNYDCSFRCCNLFEEMGKLLCKQAFLTTSPMTSLQLQGFEGLLLMIHTIAANVDKESMNPGESLGPPYPAVEIKEYEPFWEDASRDDMELESWLDALRMRKAQKKRLLMAGNHFNQDEKKGLEYLKLSNLVPHNPPDPKAFAYFFRFTPRLNKTAVGDYLGDPDNFHLEVLNEFTGTFEFSGMLLDCALRSYLETFRLPGESQKIHRILEAFSERFYDQQSSDLFETKDAVFVLCYSLIMLNTDQHNPQVKKKMTEDEFIKNNRAINAGKDLPREYLCELFQSIANNAITMFGQLGPIELTPSRWIELINQSKITKPFTLCSFEPPWIGRDMFATVAGPCVSALTAIFEHAEEDEITNESVEGLISVARIAQYGLEDILDELLASMCKFTTLLNPYASTEETLYIFANETKPRMATLAVFTIANRFAHSIRGAWRDIVECMLKLKRLKLLPPSVVQPPSNSLSIDQPAHSRSGSGNVPFGSNPKAPNRRHSSSMVGKFSPFLPMDGNEDSLVLMGSEFEQNVKIIQQCNIGDIFNSNLPEESLTNLGRTLIFAAAGRGQKFSTALDEEETVTFCWDLILKTSLANVEKISTFWPAYHDYILTVAQPPQFSPVPFAEKAFLALFKITLALLSSYRIDKSHEEILFKSINLMWKLDMEILDTCCDLIIQSVSKIINDYPANVQTQLGWKSLLHLLSVAGRHPEAYNIGVETLIGLISNATYVSKTNYTYCIDCAFGFVALRNSPIEINIKILDLLAKSVSLLVHWSKNFSDPGSSNSNMEEHNMMRSSNYMVNLFFKLGEVLRKTSLARREEIRNHTIFALKKSFLLAQELEFTSVQCMSCFNYIVFAMVDDLHEKMIEYSTRENAEKEMRSMENTLGHALELMEEVFVRYLRLMAGNATFNAFWMGFLRRLDTCIKADLGEYGESRMRELVPEMLKRIITEMKDQGVLVPREDDDLWELTYVQLQWIAPSLGDSNLM